MDPAPIRVSQYLDRTLPGIEANLALDEALLLAAEEREAGPSLRIWEAPRLAVILGASCRIRENVDVDRCQADGVLVARRASGGGTVVIGPGALNLSVVLPMAAAPAFQTVESAQAHVLQRIASALRSEGLDVGLKGSADLTLGDRKFAGSAQRRLRAHFLVHTSILYRFPLDPIVRYTRLPPRQPAYRASRSHEAFLTNLALPRERLVAAIQSAWLALDGPISNPEVPLDLIEQLLAEKYQAEGWVERF